MKKRLLVILTVLVGLFFIAPQYDLSEASEPTPIMQWHMDEGSGTSILDSIGNNNGTMRAGLPWTEGVSQKALQFNGAWNEYVAFGQTLNASDEMTVEIWVNPGFDTSDPNQYSHQEWTMGRMIIRKAAYVGDTFVIGTYGNPYYWAGKPYLEFALRQADDTLLVLHVPAELLQQGKWSQIVGTFKRNDHIRLYVNGVKVAEDHTSDAPIRQSLQRIVIGQVADIAGGEYYFINDPTWIGKIDETAIYDKALTPDEVQQHYNVILDKVPPTINIITPVDNAIYLYQQVVNADYACSDSDSGVAIGSGPVPNGGLLDTSLVGLKSFTVTGTDKIGNSGSSRVEYSVKYDWSGFLQPINADGSSIFKLGRTVPVKFNIIGNSAGTDNAVAHLYVAKIDNNVDGTETEAISTSAADSWNTFRYDTTAQQYIFNLGTNELTTGTYKLKVYVGGDNKTGVLQGEVNISLK